MPFTNKLLVVLFFASVTYAGNAQENFTLQEITDSSNTNKPTLLIFSGSDWCPNCMRFDKYILHDSSFAAYAQKELLVQIVDFPQRKRLSKETVKRNKQLADIYNPEGKFPTIVLLSPNKETYEHIFWNNEDAASFQMLLKKSTLSL